MTIGQDPIQELRAAFLKQQEIINAQQKTIAELQAGFAAQKSTIDDYGVKIASIANATVASAQDDEAADDPAAVPAKPAAKINAQDAAYYAALKEMGIPIDKE